LRDVVSYPLNLSAKEKEDFVNKVLEEHWNYRGSYKFFTNNCAVESFDLLKNALNRSQLQGPSSVSPKGVLDDLDQLEFLSIKSGTEETYKAQTSQLIQAFKEAYGQKGKDAKKDKKSLLKFISDSSSQERLSVFRKFAAPKITSPDLHTEMTLMKARLVKASSFSVLEQQILRSKTSEFRKKAADLFINSKEFNDEKMRKLIAERAQVLGPDFADLTTAGYGVPLKDEMITRQAIEQKSESSKEAIASIENALRELMPKEIAVLEAVNANIKTFNETSLGIRKEYRAKLDQYIRQVIRNLTLDDQGRTLLISAINSKESLDKVRDLLDKVLVSDKEILDIKLRKIIQDALN
ncbi:MAG: lipoprotein N-acyltransferase Lnb domain-containing protein, partial [Bacteriovorax sp.]